VALSPWRNLALPPLPSIVGLVPVMINRTVPSGYGPAQVPQPPLSIVQHNCLGSWNVFLSLFESFKETTTYPSIVLLQDPPVSKAHLPSFNGFKSFFPPVRKPRVAAYVYVSFLSNYTVLPRFKGVDDVLALDVSSHEPLFGTDLRSFRIINAYSTNTVDHRIHSIPPDTLFPDVGLPVLVVGDLNIHNPLSDPLRSFSPREISSSTPYFEKAAGAGFALLNAPGEYTRFPLVGNARPSVIDLAFANPLLLPFVKSWEATLPSTGSDHIPITITLAPPSPSQKPPRPRWADTDWESLTLAIKAFGIPPAPICPTTSKLDEWLSEWPDRLVALLKEHTPVSRPSHYSKPWWSSHLTILRREYHKATRLAEKHDTPHMREVPSTSKAGYFKAIKAAKNKHWSSFLLTATPQSLSTAKRFAYGRSQPRFPSLPGAETPQQMNQVLLDHFFPPKEPFTPPLRLRPHQTVPPLTTEEIAAALCKCSPTSAPGPDGIPYSTWKQVNKINPSILLETLAPLVNLGYHPATLKSSNGVVLDKPGKPSYESPSSFRIIVLIRTFSKILERIIAARLLTAARSKGLLHPNQCSSLPGLSTYDACLTLTNEVKTLQRPRLKVSSQFLDIKAGFDNVDHNTLARILREGGIPPYLVSWVSSFLGERSCTLIFQGAPGTPAPVNVGAPQGSPISPLLFLLYVSPLHFSIPRGLMISYVDDFALTVASRSDRGNIRRLQMIFDRLEAKAARLGVSFSVQKTELIDWRTPSQRHSPKCASPIQIKGELFHRQDSVRWLGYWFTPALDPSAHFSRRLALAQGAFALVRRLSPPGAGLAPYLCHRLATSLIAPIVLYGADLFTPSVGTTNCLNSFWHNVQRWTTNCFSATHTGILSIESSLPPVSLLIAHRQRLAAIRIVCSPPQVNQATARLHPTFPSLSIYRAPDSARALTKGLTSVYLPLHWKTPRPVPPIRNNLPVDAVAHRTLPFTHGLSRMPMINSHRVSPSPVLPPQSLMNTTYSALKASVRNALLEDWARFFPAPSYYRHLPALTPRPFMGLGKFVAGRIHQMRAGKSYLAAHPTWRSPDADTSSPRCGLEPETFEHAILSCPSKQDVRSRLLHGVTDVGHEAPHWSSVPLLKGLAAFISVTSTGFPPTMFPPTTPPSSPPFPLSPPMMPAPVFRVFSLAEV